MARDVIDVAYDGSSVAIRFGKVKIPLTKLEGGDNLKPEIVRRLGLQEQAARTDGTYETEEGSAEMEVGVWKKLLLPNLPPNGYGNFPFPILGHQNHPELGVYSVIYDRVRIVGVKEPLENTEKAALVTLKLSVMQIWRKGSDNVWRSLNRVSTQAASTDAQLLL